MVQKWGKFEVMARGVMARIGVEKEKIMWAAKRRLAVFGFGAIVSLGVMMPAVQWVGGEFYKSGFYQFSVLVFSDTAVAMIYWKELSLSMAEALPIMEITILLSVVFVFLWVVKLTSENANKLLTMNFQ